MSIIADVYRVRTPSHSAYTTSLRALLSVLIHAWLIIEKSWKLSPRTRVLPLGALLDLGSWLFPSKDRHNKY